ncbi:MAG: nucleotidyl transferase AbiEii/AbiGii toxin family protein [Dehalococcoidia bacterium]|nr:nucleotidyl transferase AbiEii/AbiGii toxin family protein [Dehalococcoidia bacterium]
MRPLRTRLEEARRQRGVQWDVLERDYLLSWILAGMGQVPVLRDTLVFKGGTALKKCYFGDYRFSEDLDFSGLDGLPAGDSLEAAVREAGEAAVRLLDEHAAVEIGCERYVEREPHPRGQEAFTLRARLPWQSRPQIRVMIEITLDEPVLWPTEKRQVLHDYEEPIEAALQVYSLEETVAEKLRAILQQADMLARRGWSRSRARDYYDLWRVLGTYRDRMDFTGFVPLLREKCAVRGVGFEGPNDFFQGPMLAEVERTWDQSLGLLVPGLPAFETVIEGLRPAVATILAPAEQP